MTSEEPGLDRTAPIPAEPQSTGPQNGSGAPEQTPPSQPPSGPVWFEPPQPIAAAAAPELNPTAVQPRKGWTRRRVGLGLAAIVVVVALVAGFVTGGFGLLNAGGAANPAEEATKVAQKTVRLFNSLSLKNLLSNPLTAAGDLTMEVAPSETRLEPRFTTLDNSDLLALSADSIDLLTELSGSFTLALDGLNSEVVPIGDDIALVNFTGGTLTVTADAERLKAALAKVETVAAAQLTATLTRYGLAPTKPIDLGLPSGWQDELVNQVKTSLPYTANLADCAAGRTSGRYGDRAEIASICAVIGQVVVVKDGGRWYFSPMLTGSLGLGAGTGQQDIAELTTPERMELLAVPAARHANPTDAPGALMKALVHGDERAKLAELPLAERRYAASSSVLSQVDLSGFESTSRFSEIARSGQQAKLRVDQLILTTPEGSVEITDGSFITMDGSTSCLSDLKRPAADMYAAVSVLDWAPFEDATGISKDKVIHKIQAATDAAIAAIESSQIGVVAVQEDGTWLVSITATVAELQKQLLAAVRTGLISIQE